MDSWWQWLDTHMGLDLDLIVYLRTTPDVAFDRMRSRGGKEESGAPLDYIKALHKVYTTPAQGIPAKKFEVAEVINSVPGGETLIRLNMPDNKFFRVKCVSN